MDTTQQSPGCGGGLDDHDVDHVHVEFELGAEAGVGVAETELAPGL